MDVISERLTKLRDEKGATQEEVAEACGMSRVTLARYENGTRKPIPKNLSRLAEYYGKTADYLLGRDTTQALVVDVSGSMKQGKSETAAIIESIMAKLAQLDDADQKIAEEHIDFLLSRKKEE